MGQFILNKWNTPMGYQEMVAYISGMSSMFYTSMFSVSTDTYQEMINISNTTTEISNSNRRFRVKDFGYYGANSFQVDSGYASITNMMGGLGITSEMQGFNTLSVNEYETTVTSSGGRFKVYNSSYTETFLVDGTNGAYSYGWNTYSDSTLKENIIPIPSSLNKVMSLEGVKFDWKHDMSADYGFIAQQVKEILPEVVKENNGLLTVNYTSIIAVQNEAIKELNKKIDKYDGIIDGLTKEIDKLRPA
jgi:cell division protein FtsL